MKKVLWSTSITLSVLLTACSVTTENNSESVTPTSDKSEKKEKASVCTYSNGDEMPTVMWIAYKYTQKTGVKGEFKEVSVSNTGSGERISDVLTGANIEINTASSNSGDPTRDPKIKETFFGALNNGERITGTITDVKGSDTEGEVMAELTMNGETKQATGNYQVEDDMLEIKFDLNVGTWSAMDALNALNKVCEDLHKGADGKSILWPDVTVFVNTALNKTCD